MSVLTSTTLMSSSELNRLAHLSSELVHGIDFPDARDVAKVRSALLTEMDTLETRYQNDGLLFDLRSAVCSRPVQKQALYEMIRGIVRCALGHQSQSLMRTTSDAPLSLATSGRSPFGESTAGVSLYS